MAHLLSHQLYLLCFAFHQISIEPSVLSPDHKAVYLTGGNQHLVSDQNQAAALPFLPGSLGEKPEDLRVEGLHLLEGLHLHLQQVVFAKFALEMLD